MFLQKVLKGIHGITEDEAESVLQHGLICNWWRRVHQITPAGVHNKLTERNLDWHLNRYDQADPLTGEPFFENTPFLSLTAGVIDRDVHRVRNVISPAFMTALSFATDGFRGDGFIFYGYVFTLGKRSVPLREFAEEVRDPLQHRSFLPFFREGEVVAKIDVPTTRLERVEKYCTVDYWGNWDKTRMPTPAWQKSNPNYLAPEDYANIRDVV